MTLPFSIRSLAMRGVAAVAVVAVGLWLPPPALAQTSDDDVYIDPNRSDPQARRTLVINANRVSTDITNYSLIGRGNSSNPSDGEGGVWPAGTGHDHIHEMTGFIGGRVENDDGRVFRIISDGFTDAGGTGGEVDPVTNVEYKFHPLPGYLNAVAGQDEIANSLNPRSWPASWPDKPASWDGAWNGFFGLNQFNADQEVFYVMDDTWNTEFDFAPYADHPDWGGLGMQVRTRLFQWTHPLARDIIFIQFEVSNAGDYGYEIEADSVFFGGYADIGVGGRGTTDDCAGFDRDRDLVYGWDCDNVGVWTRFREIPPGYIGWKYLESPGIDADGVDNDNDGLVDERRDNDAGQLVNGPCGIYGPPQEHWEGDEDCDWNPEIDDVGQDGAGPLTEGYPGPDAGEGNGRPDQGEPNFGRLDKDESDQVGLTSFTAPLFGAVQISDEGSLWERIQPGFFSVPRQAVNQYWIFSSGPFNLAPEATERFSTSWVFGRDEQAAFQSAAVAQRIYDADYRFARPPRQPELQAIPGDGKVVLVWDDLAETSRDPIYGRDFEGYRIYRSTDPNFNDVEDITDARGNAVFQVPIAQYDLANGLEGPHPLQFGQLIGEPTGIHFFMGEDTGIQHFFVDDEVLNGRTYYYAVRAYDQGYDVDFFERGISELDDLAPITPSESPAAIITRGGKVDRQDPNTAIATPNPSPSNVEPGDTDVDGTLQQSRGVATGGVNVQVISPDLLPEADYRVDFGTTEQASPVTFETTTFSVLNETTGEYLVQDAPVPTNFATGEYLRTWQRELLNSGFVLGFENEFPTTNDARQASDWSDDAATNLQVEVDLLFDSSPVQPLSFVVEVGEEEAVLDSAFTSRSGNSTKPVNFQVYELRTGEPLDFVFQEVSDTENGRIDPRETLFIVYPTDNFLLGASWSLAFSAPTDADGNDLPEEDWRLPQAGDRYVVRNQIPFSERDTYRFSTTPTRTIDGAGEDVLDEIQVVPNPYVAASILESQPALSGRGERIIRFTNLPAQCTISIYTVNGDLVRTLRHDGLSDGTVRWDLKSKDGLEVAFGLYVYHVDAPGIGEHVGKFAIIN